MSSELTQLIFDESPDELVVLSADGTVTFWKPGAHRIFGYAADEAIGKSICELVVPDDRVEDETQLLQAYESLRRCNNGSLVHVDISAKAIRHEKGKLICILTTKTEVTQLKALRDAKLVEPEFRDLFESNPDAIIMASPTGRIVFANSQAGKLFGYEPGELRGQLVEVLLPARYHGGHVAHRSNYVAKPRTRTMGVGMELFGVRKDGVEFSVEISLNPLKTDESALVMSAIRDTSELKKAEQKFRGLLKVAPDAIVIANRDGETVLVNAQTENRFGYRREETFRQKSRDLSSVVLSAQQIEAVVAQLSAGTEGKDRP